MICGLDADLEVPNEEIVGACEEVAMEETVESTVPDGTSILDAISTEMFDILYKHCPLALEYAGHDDINPLCIAAMKNDKEIFFKLVDLGLDVKNSSKN